MGSALCDASRGLRRRAAFALAPWRALLGFVALRAQQISVDGRDLFDDLPPPPIIGHPSANGRQDCGGQRNLLGAPPRETDGEDRGCVQLAGCTTAIWLTTANRAFEDAAAQDFFDGRQLLDDPLTSRAQLVDHISAVSLKDNRQSIPSHAGPRWIVPLRPCGTPSGWAEGRAADGGRVTAIGRVGRSVTADVHLAPGTGGATQLRRPAQPEAGSSRRQNVSPPPPTAQTQTGRGRIWTDYEGPPGAASRAVAVTLTRRSGVLRPAGRGLSKRAKHESDAH